MTDYEMIPANGYILAYSQTGILYNSYTLEGANLVLGNGITIALTEWTEQNGLDGYYEVHLFDSVTEYRRLCTGKECKEMVMHQSDEKNDADHYYHSETLLLNARFCKENVDDNITIVNYFRYTEDDALQLVNYRMAISGGCLKLRNFQ